MDRLVETRAAQVVDVDYPERIIELVVIPYDTETVVGHQGRAIRESVARGAFDGIERRANRVKAWLGHPKLDPHAEVVGRSVAFQPDRPEGLVARLRITRRSPIGDDILRDAEDGILDASAGFAIPPDGEQWTDQRTARRVQKAILDHVALVPDPAYPDARVLAVRSAGVAGSPTPNLDAVLAWRLQDRVASLGK
jgi:HK97 family phage prohead protease